MLLIHYRKSLRGDYKDQMCPTIDNSCAINKYIKSNFFVKLESFYISIKNKL